MSKSRDAFRTISEVSDILDTPAHVLRFWESKFNQVKPVKRAGGRRYYRPADVDLLAGIKQLLHDDGMTIKGAQKLLREQGVKHVSALGSQQLDAQDAAIDATHADQADTPAIDASPEPAPEPQEPDLELDITNVVSMPAPAATGPKLSVDLPQQDVKTCEPEPENDPAPAARARHLDIPADPSDADSKAPARLFHLLHKADHDKLAARAEAIAPLLDRMQVLRDRIHTR